MSNNPSLPRSEDQGQAEALSNEVLKLKVDDLFQEIESLRRRVDRLEAQSHKAAVSERERPGQAGGVVSNPDRPS